MSRALRQWPVMRVRTAVIATAVVAGLMLVLCVAVDVQSSRTRCARPRSMRLTAELHQLVHEAGGRALDEPDLDDPLLVWRLDDGRKRRSVDARGARRCPHQHAPQAAPTEMAIAGSDVLVAGASFQGGRLIGAISLSAEFELVHDAPRHRGGCRADPPGARLRWRIRGREAGIRTDRARSTTSARVHRRRVARAAHAARCHRSRDIACARTPAARGYRAPKRSIVSRRRRDGCAPSSRTFSGSSRFDSMPPDPIAETS